MEVGPGGASQGLCSSLGNCTRTGPLPVILLATERRIAASLRSAPRLPTNDAQLLAHRAAVCAYEAAHRRSAGRSRLFIQRRVPGRADPWP